MLRWRALLLLPLFACAPAREQRTPAPDPAPVKPPLYIPPKEGPRFSVLIDSGEGPYSYGDHWERQEMGQRPRLLIGVDEDGIGLMLELAATWHKNYYALYVLGMKQGKHELGRYESRPLDFPAVKALFTEFRGFFEGDARHQVWIGSPVNEGTLVYDHHNVIYAYGNLEAYEQVLLKRRFVRGKVEIPFPHQHRTHDQWDAALDHLLNDHEWHRTDLQPGDED